MSKAMLVDFDAEAGFNFDEMRRIGVVIEDGSGGVSLRYRSEVIEDEADTGFLDYVRTLQRIEPFLEAWNRRAESQDWRVIFTRLANESYLGLRFRVVSLVEDEVTVDDAYERYVVNGEDIPVVEDEELIDV